jgi:enamine deaminase RidA (YjgF/YER057c/UK114 family)
MAGRIDAKLKELGISLPIPAAPIANYVPYLVAGNVVSVSGQGPAEGGTFTILGRVGEEVTLEEGYRAARLCFISVLGHLKVACGGDLDRVRQVVRLGGFVATAPDFKQHAAVMNGASDLAVAVFGDAGRHTRTTVGAATLPMGIAVEVEGMFWIA